MKVKHFAIIALAFVIPLAACSKKVSPQVAANPASVPPSNPPNPEIKPPPVSAVTPDPPREKSKPAPVSPPPKPVPNPPAPSSFLVGEQKFDSGDYQDAALSLEEFLKKYPDHERSEEATFRLGLAYALTDNTARSRRQAREQLQKFLIKFPKSPYRHEADYILKLQQDIDRLRSDGGVKDKKIERLSEELERLKKIDLNRKPSRPPLKK